MKATIVIKKDKKKSIGWKGGPGSGFAGHAGIPGHQGGSQASGTAAPKLGKPPTRRAYGGELYKVVGEVDRPSWGVHGGHYKLSSKGKKAVAWAMENEDAFLARVRSMDKRSTFLDSKEGSISRVFDFANQLGDENTFAGDDGITMAEHELDMFNDFADVYNTFFD